MAFNIDPREVTTLHVIYERYVSDFNTEARKYLDKGYIPCGEVGKSSDYYYQQFTKLKEITNGVLSNN